METKFCLEHNSSDFTQKEMPLSDNEKACQSLVIKLEHLAEFLINKYDCKSTAEAQEKAFKILNTEDGMGLLQRTFNTTILGQEDLVLQSFINSGSVLNGMSSDSSCSFSSLDRASCSHIYEERWHIGEEKNSFGDVSHVLHYSIALPHFMSLLVRMDRAEMLKYLIHFCIERDDEGFWSGQALHTAVEHDAQKSLHVLLNNGARVETHNHAGRSALFKALSTDKLDFASSMLSHLRFPLEIIKDRGRKYAILGNVTSPSHDFFSEEYTEILEQMLANR